MTSEEVENHIMSAKSSAQLYALLNKVKHEPEHNDLLHLLAWKYQILYDKKAHDFTFDKNGPDGHVMTLDEIKNTALNNIATI